MCPRDCFDTCGMLYENGKLKGDKSHPFTSGLVCGKASLSLRQVNDVNRVVKPMVRTAHGFEKITLDLALNIAAEQMNRSKGKVYRIDYSGHMGILSRFFHQRLFRQLGAPEVTWDICSTAGDNELLDGFGSIYGSDIDEIRESDFLIIWGANIAYSSIHAFTWARQVKNVFVIDPVQTDTAAAFNHVPVRPGGDVALVLQLLMEMKKRGYEVPLDMSKFTNLEDISGVSQEVVNLLCDGLLKSANPFVFLGYGFQRQWNGGLCVRLIVSLLDVIGKRDHFYFDRPYYGIDVDYVRLGSQKPNNRSISWTKLSEELRGEHGAVFFVLNANPLNTIPDRRTLIKAFKSEDNFVIVHDLFMTETAQAADLVFPAKHYLEFEDVIPSYGHKYLGFNEIAFSAPENSMSNMELSRALSEKLGLKNKELYENDIQLIDGALRPLNVSYDYLKEKKRIALPEPPKVGHPNWPSDSRVLSNLNREKEGSFLLLTPVARLRLHSQYDNEINAVPILEINVDDAAQLRICDGELARIENERGSLDIACKVTSRVPRGVLRLEHGFWTDIDAPNVNDLIDSTLQKGNMGSQLMWNFVDIRPVGKGA